MAQLRFRPLGGTSRRYEDRKTGETRSQRYVRNFYARKAGFANIERQERDQSWRAFRHRAAENGVKVSYNSKLAEDYGKVKRTKRSKRTPGGKKYSETPLGRILIAQGKGDEESEWREGGTP